VTNQYGAGPCSAEAGAAPDQESRELVKAPRSC
jgi:hypothetical protein